MKRTVIIIFLLQIVWFGLSAQDQYDALLITREINSGTARFIGLGGAFGSLGGDMSVAGINPAGLAIYRSPVLTITPGVFNNTSTSTFSEFNNLKNDDFEYRMTLDNIGYIWAKSNKSGSLAGSAFGFGYNKLNDFNQRIIIGPVNSENTSLADYYTNRLNDTENTFSDFELDYYVYPFLDAGIVVDRGSEYANDFRDAEYGQTMEKSITRYGNKGEYFISYAANFSDILYVGGTFGIQKFTFNENTNHLERDIDNRSDTINSINFREYYEIEGSGVNFKFGMIFRPVDFLRLGAAFHSPTKYSLTSNYFTIASAAFDQVSGYSNTSVYSPEAEFDYEVLTPYKAIFSLGFILDKYGLISIDYEWVDYTKMKLQADGESYSDINSEINDDFVSTSNIKAGAEIRLGTISLRGGYAFYGDPYSSVNENSGQDISVFSGGLGINSKNYFIDFGLVSYELNEKHNLYYDYSSKINSRLTKFLVTLGFRF